MFSFANCCLVPNQMNLVFWALRRSRFEDIQPARAPIAWCMVQAAPIVVMEGQCKYARVSSAYTSCSQSMNAHRMLKAHDLPTAALHSVARAITIAGYYTLGMYRISVRYPVYAGYLTIRYYPDLVKLLVRVNLIFSKYNIEQNSR